MSGSDETLGRFFEQWTEEFARAIEMFTGVKPGIACSSAETEEARQLASPAWWKQVFQSRAGSDSDRPSDQSDQQFTTWIGVPEETWMRLATAMAAEANQERQMFTEMLGQAQQGAAAALSGALAQPLRCLELEECQPPELDPLAVRRISIELREGALPPLLLAIEWGAAQVLALDASKGKIVAQRPGTVARSSEPAPRSEILDRLMDIDLPLSVALGRAVLPIRDILKMTPGALVELDRDIGEYVDILVHGTVVARGEVVSVKGNYGVRIKEIISREDRLALSR